MFFKRRKSVEPVESSSSEIITIPEVFYAGNDPEAQDAAKNSGSSKQTDISPMGPPPARTRLIAGGMITIFLIVLAGGGWYLFQYLGFGSKAKTPIVPENKTAELPPIAAPIPAVETTSTSDLTITTSTISVVTSTAVAPVRQLAIEFPPIIQIDATDLDADGLTDAEEELLGTDPAIFDTDNDNYYDGQEVSNLYNPKALAPVRLIDSGSVQELVHTRNLYRAYYPLAWQVGVVDPAGDSTLLTATNGDYIEFRISPKNPGEDFTSWFARSAGTERITDVQVAVNRYGTSYSHRKDDLVAYVEKPNFVLVIIYHPQSNAPIVFRHIMQMVFASLRLGDTTEAAFQPTFQETVLTAAPTTSAPVGTSPSTSLDSTRDKPLGTSPSTPLGTSTTP